MDDPKPGSSRIAAIFLANRPVLLAFLRSRNAGDSAEDLLQELWLRLPRQDADIVNQLSYMFRMADLLLIDQHRRVVQARRREIQWSDAVGSAVPGRSEQPSADRAIESRQVTEQVWAVLHAQGDRVVRIFRRHRLDGVTQRDVAAEIGVSVSTVEGDLRRAYGALFALRENLDKE